MRRRDGVKVVGQSKEMLIHDAREFLRLEDNSLSDSDDYDGYREYIKVSAPRGEEKR